MKKHDKTLLAGIVTFLIGTSCCWITALSLWLGGIGILTSIIKYVENFQIQLLLIGLFLILGSVYLKYRKRKKS